MVFSSSLFLLYFLPGFLIIYYIVPRQFKNWWLLLASILFYAWGAPKFVFFLAGSVIIDYFIAKEIASSEKARKKAWFWLSVILNITLLLYFKYMNFFIDQWHVILGWFGGKPSDWTKIVLPVGISFITFQKLAYIFEMSRKSMPPFKRIQDFALYIFMFPQLLSGPIVRPGQIADQFADRKSQENISERLIGLYRFVIGLAKKVLIADVLATIVNPIFEMGPNELSTGLAWTGAVAYTFQIYFDFSGYTDMAIGLAKMVGFRIPENFNNPYVSKNITEFWRRWHMTLSFWFRDYLFLPLAYATSRKMPRERYIGLRADKVIYLMATTVTFLLCGFWHGAAWTFIAWGAYMGLFLILDRLFLLKFLKKIGSIPSIVINFAVLTVGWVLFRSATLDDFWFFLSRMFSFVSIESDLWLNPKFWTMLMVAFFFSFWGVFKRVERWQEKFYNDPGSRMIISMSVLAILLFILCEAAITSSGFSPFIYFRF